MFCGQMRDLVRVFREALAPIPVILRAPADAKFLLVNKTGDIP
jgi:hypothetical protein